MLDFLLFLITAWSATAAGRSLLRVLRLPEDATILERNLCGFALGLGMLSYAMLLLGLLHGLYPIAGWLLVAALGAAGLRSHGEMGRELRDGLPRMREMSSIGWALAGVLSAFAFISLIGCYAPPTLLEWDSIAYHLADPKLYLQAHRIYYLPWEDHSNFGFTAEMWYLFGLIESGVPLAKLFHFACGAGTCLAIYAFASRLLTPVVGKVSAVLFASTPVVFWEAGTAYVDLATAFYTMLTILAVGRGVVTKNDQWLRLGAVLMGLTLSTKATALGTLALLALGVGIWRLRVLKHPVWKAAQSLAIWCLIALAVGSPWFVKSTIYTGNPVYPFFYSIFGGRGWNAAAADYYRQWNAAFGMGHSLQDALLVPWNLILYLLPGHPSSYPKPFNDYQTPLETLSPVLLATLFFPAFGVRTPGSVKALAAFALGSLLFWFVTMEYVRYMLPTLPVLCVLAGWVIVRAVQTRGISGYVLAGLSVCSLAFSLMTGGSLLLTQAPVVFGQVSRDDYIVRGFAPYSAMQYINTALPPQAKIVFYGNPLGFYCDRPYVWGDAMHGTTIPYATFRNAEDLRRYLNRLHITHILVTERYFPLSPSTPGAEPYPGWVYQMTAGSGPPVFSQNGTAIWLVPNRLSPPK